MVARFTEAEILRDPAPLCSPAHDFLGHETHSDQLQKATARLYLRSRTTSSKWKEINDGLIVIARLWRFTGRTRSSEGTGCRLDLTER